MSAPELADLPNLFKLDTPDSFTEPSLQNLGDQSYADFYAGEGSNKTYLEQLMDEKFVDNRSPDEKILDILKNETNDTIPADQEILPQDVEDLSEEELAKLLKERQEKLKQLMLEKRKRDQVKLQEKLK